MWFGIGWWPTSSGPMSRPSNRNRRDSLLMTPRFRTFITGLILALTVALSWTAMLMGQQLAAVSVTVGEPSPETFQADSALEIEDVEATERARKAARDAVDPVYGRQEEIDDIVISDIQAFFRSVREATVDPTANPFSAVTTSSTIPATTTSSSTTLVTAPQTTVETDPETASVASPTTTTVVTPPAPVSANAGVSGRIFIDQDANGLYSSGTDRGLDGIRVVAYDADGTRYETVSFSDGRYSLGRMAPGPATVLIDTDTVHERLTGPEHLLLQEVDLVNFQEIAAIPIPLRPAVTPRDIQLAALRARGLLLSDRAIST
ncbi:MAG: hypothetical protein F4211_00585, partial [Acidimicrobiia bacterium]|nr:hypothetical protein [Acidimicrobiia bacterium]